MSKLTRSVGPVNSRVMDEKKSNVDKVLRSIERSDLKSRIEELKRQIAEVEAPEGVVPEKSFKASPKDVSETQEV